MDNRSIYDKNVQKMLLNIIFKVDIKYENTFDNRNVIAIVFPKKDDASIVFPKKDVSTNKTTKYKNIGVEPIKKIMVNSYNFLFNK